MFGVRSLSCLSPRIGGAEAMWGQMVPVWSNALEIGYGLWHRKLLTVLPTRLSIVNYVRNPTVKYLRPDQM